MIYKTIEEWNERNPNHIGPLPIEVCRQIWGTKDTLAQPEQEPIGYVSEGAAERLTTVKQAHENIKNFRLFTHDVPLYTTPPQRTWIDSGLIGVLKHCEDLLREDGHDDAVDDVQNMIAKIKTRAQA